MSDWFTYANVTGTIGTVAGIAGTVVAGISLKRSGRKEERDLRIDLRTRVRDVRHAFDALPDLMNRANTSRIAVQAATGLHRSGQALLWERALAVDSEHIEAMRTRMPDIQETFGGLAPEQLENRLVELRSLQLEIDVLQNKYQAALTEDDERRREIRELHMQPRR
ncbi:hypothetical protein BLA6993_07022 [Burkholderia lata]|uniref:hypothetical protein n=1 Tax=Burkholderia lata (strain ATCC 17760 / DSM 23089 / LMG 22485 / NCIMB 9086 / R18194 / 383) TaxID=482957 RepID=UPI001453CB46|nr:hypothetical protein [Burkholderia lata]VWC40543.1 hypothetical protein BLA6993_07022 [Burkholderia lata]